MADLFYLQDSRSYTGNDMIWWRPNGVGYTTDLRQAAVYTKEEAQARHDFRNTDIPWPKAYIDERTRPAMDFQFAKQKEALAGTGIEIRKPKMPRRYQVHCTGCGRILSDRQVWSGACPHCGADNRP